MTRSRKPLNLLVMNNGYLTNSPSGGARNMLDIAGVWARTHRVRFLMPNFATHLLSPEVEAVGYNSPIPRSVFGTIYAYIRRMGKAIGFVRTAPADIVFSSSSLFYDVLPAWIHQRRHGSHWAVFIFHLIPVRKSSSLLQKIQFSISSFSQSLCLPLYRKADTVFAGNSLVREQLLAMGIAESRIEIYFPAINVELIESVEATPRYDILFIARLVARKGVFDLLEALDGLDLRLGLVGEGEARAELEQTIAVRGLEHQVDLLGALPSEEMYSLLKGSRCFVFPSYEEGYGIVIAEALSAKVPVITYKLPHYPEAFGDAPYYLDVGSVSGLREALEKLQNGIFPDRGTQIQEGSSPPINNAQAAADKSLAFILREK